MNLFCTLNIRSCQFRSAGANPRHDAIPTRYSSECGRLVFPLLFFFIVEPLVILLNFLSLELSLVREYTNCNSLDQAGRVLFHLNRIPQVAERLELHEICFSWLSAATGIASQLRVVQHACDELTSSQDLMKKLLAMYVMKSFWFVFPILNNVLVIEY